MSKIIKAISIVALCACLFCAAIAFCDTPTTSAASKVAYECAEFDNAKQLTMFLNSNGVNSENIIYIGEGDYYRRGSYGAFDVKFVVIYKK